MDFVQNFVNTNSHKIKSALLFVTQYIYEPKIYPKDAVMLSPYCISWLPEPLQS